MIRKNSDVPAGGQTRKRIRQATNTIIDKAWSTTELPPVRVDLRTSKNSTKSEKASIMSPSEMIHSPPDGMATLKRSCVKSAPPAAKATEAMTTKASRGTDESQLVRR